MNLAAKKLLIKSKKRVFSEIHGNNSSLLKADGYDFLELKEYDYGNDVKNIDWVISAKLQKLYVKVFHAQKELNITIVNIMGGSMHFGLHKLKSDLCNEIACLLGFIAIKQGDPFASYILNENLELLTKASKKIFAVSEMNQKISQYKCLNKSIDYRNLGNILFKNIRKKSLLFLLSDFLESETLDLRLLSKKHEVYVIVIREKFEEKPFALSNVNFIDPSNGKNFSGLLSKKALNNYQEKIKQNDQLLYEHTESCGIKIIKIYTNDDALAKLMGFLK